MVVVCCVPNCGTNSWKCDPSITFHDFPSNPDLAAKWIKQINTAIKSRPMWFPRGRPVICSKHFLQTDFRGDTDALRPRSIPTVFGYKYIGQNPEAYTYEINKLNENKKSPLIVKVIKPQDASQNNSGLIISDVRSEAVYNCDNIGRKELEFAKTNLINKYASFQKTNITNNNYDINSACNFQSNKSNTIQNKNKINVNGITNKNSYKKNVGNQSNHLLQKNVNKKQSDLIEIGPNTFLKINPDIIKVNKKLTPSGNTVLQFLMDEKLAKSQSADLLPKLIQGTSSTIEDCTNIIEEPSLDKPVENDQVSNLNQQKNGAVHVLGHLVDTHMCTETCTDCKVQEENLISDAQNQNADQSTIADKTFNKDKYSIISEPSNKQPSNNTATSFMDKAPVLLTTNMPLSHCFMDKSKYQLTLKQKNRQIASLKFKVSNLQKKIEELEDRCIVQERQLSYSFIKRLKTIRKNASKGDPSATYILEQIRSYTNNSKMRWSDSTLTQCAIWCRKAPYAYEYFKKADFFKLPCLGTVKRFMKKHPEIKFQKKKNSDIQEDDDESSSDFDFDESDDQNEANGFSEDANDAPVTCETVLTIQSDASNPATTHPSGINEQISVNNETIKISENVNTTDFQKQLNVQSTVCKKDDPKTEETSKYIEPIDVSTTADNSNLELQEIILPSGEVVQCYGSNINDTDATSQYFIIPNVGDQTSVGDNEYNVVQADTLPVILQNLENSHLHLQQEQLVFITHPSNQVECNETEVTSA